MVATKELARRVEELQGLKSTTLQKLTRYISGIQ